MGTTDDRLLPTTAATSVPGDAPPDGASPEEGVDGRGHAKPTHLVDCRGIARAFGATCAVDDVDFSVAPAEVVGLVGGNGAGKSTLMRLVGGLLSPDSGELEIAGSTVGADHSPRLAQRLGVRFVHQELSLCSNLRVLENFALELPELFSGLGWRRQAAAFAKAALEEVFPGSSISPRAKVSSLSVSQRQMVEVARACSDPALRLLILDEPTSSLGAREAGQLLAYVKRRRDEGVSFVFISHRLRESLDLADRIVVMQNGKVVWQGGTSELEEADLVRLMGGALPEELVARDVGTDGPPAERDAEQPLVTVESLSDSQLRDVSLTLRRGEILGLAGLEASGQRPLLRRVFEARTRRLGQISIDGAVAFVSGDRAGEGVFRLWSIAKNITVASLGRIARLGYLEPGRERALADTWFERLRIRARSPSAPILSLSGGNQQKVMIARALASNADVVVLDDPTRGVDLRTKQELYRLFRALADEGKGLLWYSTDDAELVECDRVLVMRSGRVVRELEGSDITPDRVIEASFTAVESGLAEDELSAGRDRRLLAACRRHVPSLIAGLVFATVFATCAIKNPDIVTSLGLTLIFSTAVPLAWAAASQAYLITAGDIDLGIGYFMGLVNVIAATWLVTDPGLAALSFVPLLLAYPLMGFFVHTRRVPAIVVTLGLSFVWLGLASYKLDRPGGSTPEWLGAAFDADLPVVPEPVYLVVFPGVVAYAVLFVCRYGVVLRGLGNNPRAVEAAGWSGLRARVTNPVDK